MPVELPKLYFRLRENGAMVFRVNSCNKQGQIELKQIAQANVRNGEIKPHRDGSPNSQEMQEISDWIDERRTLLERRAYDDAAGTVDRLNLTAQWAQSRASDEELDAVTDDLLLAMHDLRMILVRKRAEARSSRSD